MLRTTIPLSINPTSIAFAGQGGTVYVLGESNVSLKSRSSLIDVINTSTGAIESRILLQNNSYAMNITPDGRFLYVASQNQNSPGTVSVIDTYTDKIISEIDVGSNPSYIAIVYAPKTSEEHLFSNLTVNLPGTSIQTTYMPCDGSGSSNNCTYINGSYYTKYSYSVAGRNSIYFTVNGYGLLSINATSSYSGANWGVSIGNNNTYYDYSSSPSGDGSSIEKTIGINNGIYNVTFQNYNKNNITIMFSSQYAMTQGSPSVTHSVSTSIATTSVPNSSVSTTVTYNSSAISTSSNISIVPHPYDLQMGLSIVNNNNFLAYNVTAVKQTDQYGVGPTYLLNGFTDSGYWYQLGVGWNWPTTQGGHLSGFVVGYEVWHAGKSVYPLNGSGIANFSGPIMPNDTILLKLSILNNTVVMQAKDWNTGANATVTYPAYGATIFQGSGDSSPNGAPIDFSGPMTEGYFATQNATEKTVKYVPYQFNPGLAYLWVAEWKANAARVLFYNALSSPVSDNKNTSFTTVGSQTPAPWYSCDTCIVETRMQYLIGGTFTTAAVNKTK